MPPTPPDDLTGATAARTATVARTPRELVLQALWLAILAGLVELLVIQAHWFLVGTVTMRTLRTNRHYVWMLPTSLLILLGGLGWIAAMVASRVRSRTWDRCATFLACFLAVASPLLALEELHPAASAVLAAGIAVSLARRLDRLPSTFPRRSLPWLAVFALLVMGWGYARVVLPEPLALATKPPAANHATNVVLLVWDTVRADHLGPHGYSRPTTPRLDALAERGMVFEHARSAAPWTLPAHASMFSGQWPHDHRATVDRPMGPVPATIAEHLGRKGYVTGGFAGNATYCSSWFGVDRGFDHYEDDRKNEEVSFLELLRCSGLGRQVVALGDRLGLVHDRVWYPADNTADRVNRQALAWLDRAKGERPFFLFLNYKDAHGPYRTPDGFPRLFHTDADREELRALRGRIKKAKPGTDPDGLSEARERMARLAIDAYDDCLRFVDDQTNALIEQLDARGLRDSTWVIITSDHGEQFGEHGLFVHGNSLYRPLVHVPLVVIPPRGHDEAVGRVSVPVSTRELARTIADLTGPASPSPFPGPSLTRFWSAGAAGPPLTAGPVLFEVDREGKEASGVLHQGTTLIRKHFNGTEELYSLEADPTEEHNLLRQGEDGAQVASRLRDRLRDLTADEETRRR